MQPYLQPADVSVDLREKEAIARTILGMALCKGLTASSATAIEWADLLSDEHAYGPLRNDLPAWKMAIYFDRGEYRAARGVLEAYRGATDDPVPLAWLRLVAVYGLEARQERADARQARQLRDDRAGLARRARPDPRPGLAVPARSTRRPAFRIQYVRGVMAYHDTRAIDSGPDPTDNPDARAGFQKAFDHFSSALAETDAGRYLRPPPRAAT